jgi:hypothetical protein
MPRSTKLPGLGFVLRLIEVAPCSGLAVVAMVWLPCEELTSWGAVVEPMVWGW